MSLQIANSLLDWLLAGDPAIRWQVQRDLLEADADTLAAERERVANAGWGAQLLAHQDSTGLWGGQLYNHKWLSTTYSLLLLRQMGLEPGTPQARLACKNLLEGGWRPNGGICYARNNTLVDDGVSGMVLSLLAYFAYPDERVHTVAAALLERQMPDGRWEPQPDNQHMRYTLAATLQVLEGLHEYARQYPARAAAANAAQGRGREFLLRRRLYQGEPGPAPLDPKMLLFAFPPRWFYDILAALDYFQACRAAPDPRLGDAIAILKAKQNPDGTWNLQNRHPGKTFFEMEEVGKPSRWNTLRALRVLKWWEISNNE